MRRVWEIVSIIALTLLDRAVKAYVVHVMPVMVHCGACLWIDGSMNTGVAFGLGRGMGDYAWAYWSVASMIIMTVIARYMYDAWRTGTSVGLYGLVFGGAMSNMIDRIVYGGVIDYVLLAVGPYAFPVFNIADVMIVVGGLLWAAQAVGLMGSGVRA